MKASAPSNRLIFHKGYGREHMLNRLVTFIKALSSEKSWVVEVKEFRRKRTNEQNAYLWGVVYPTLLKKAGSVLDGWTAEDLHEFFLGEHFGWETREGLGGSISKPIKRSSKLTTMEFAEYVEFIQMRAAEYGVYIPDPKEEIDLDAVRVQGAA